MPSMMAPGFAASTQGNVVIGTGHGMGALDLADPVDAYQDAPGPAPGTGIGAIAEGGKGTAKGAAIGGGAGVIGGAERGLAHPVDLPRLALIARCIYMNHNKSPT
jgi:hypothetical protein